MPSMKLTLGIASALVAMASAAEPGHVYMMPRRSIDDTPSIPRSIARLILLQHFDPLTQEVSADSIFRDNTEQNLEWINAYGTQQSLFAGKEDTSSTQPKQLLIMLEGMPEDKHKTLGERLEMEPAFTIADPPRSTANDRLIKHDLYNAGVTGSEDCSIDKVVDIKSKSCWSDGKAVLRYNVASNPDTFSELSLHLDILSQLAKEGQVETAILIQPSSAEKAGPRSWEDSTANTHSRRQAEQPITASSSKPVSALAAAPIPACFPSKENCENVTSSCSGHGECLDKYSKSDGSSGDDACYTCHCLATKSDSGSVTHWAGAVCQKKDVSVPFWLFAGFTILLLGITSLAIGMLYSVGEEKLPGVIGAGVSRSK